MTRHALSRWTRVPSLQRVREHPAGDLCGCTLLHHAPVDQRSRISDHQRSTEHPRDGDQRKREL